MITFEKLIFKLFKFWNKLGCCVVQPIDIEVGAATFHPITFFSSIKKNKIFYSYIQLCRRPVDSKFGNILSNKLSQYYQFQVIIKPSIINIQDMYINSLKYLGINFNKCELKFIEDNWENPTLGANGYGWEVWLDGIEVTQFTYFQKMANIDCVPVLVEITYGLERLSLYLQNINSIYNLIWCRNKNIIIKYKDIILNNEFNKSIYNFYESNIDFLVKCMINYENESLRLLNIKKPLLIISYEYALKFVNIFNILDSKEYFSVYERKKYIIKIRDLFNKIAILKIRNNIDE